MEHLGLYPVDTLKTHMQASGSHISLSKTARILYKEEGFLRFWHGANVVASGCIPAHAAQFSVYEFLKAKLDCNHERYEFFNTMFIGACSTLAHDFFIAPSDVIKQRLQLCQNLSTSQALKNMMQNEGISGLWRSYPVTVVLNIPFTAVVVCANENFKTLFKPWERQNPHLWYFICAGIAGGIAGMITNPLDVVKTRLQTQEITPSCSRLVKLWKRELDLINQTENMGKKQAEEAINVAKKGTAEEPPKLSKASCNFEVKKVHYSNMF